ncbi:hypothetical protein [Catellatospora vulcania]|uniref:hypothetical protein n=1 Tax=Catellatospora vulcania TaxID=1460450 RepID=UPI0012D3C8E0|nr:hypothetical protein [Catellatospora vulcania]
MQYSALSDHHTTRTVVYSTVGFLLVAAITYYTQDGDLTLAGYILGCYLLALGLLHAGVQAVATVLEEHENWRRRTDQATRRDS